MFKKKFSASPLCVSAGLGIFSFGFASGAIPASSENGFHCTIFLPLQSQDAFKFFQRDSHCFLDFFIGIILKFYNFIDTAHFNLNNFEMILNILFNFSSIGNKKVLYSFLCSSSNDSFVVIFSFKDTILQSLPAHSIHLFSQNAEP